MPQDTFLTSPAYEARYCQLRRALQRKYVRRKPTRLERAAIDTAALLGLRAEIMTADASASADTLAKAVAASRGAIDHLAKIAAERERERVFSSALPMSFPQSRNKRRSAA